MNSQEIETLHAILSNKPAGLVAEKKVPYEIAQLRKDCGFAPLNNQSLLFVATREEQAAKQRYETLTGMVFIPDRQMEMITKKYKLTQGRLGQFKADVPLKNLKEIKAFLHSGIKRLVYDIASKQDEDWGAEEPTMTIIAPEEMFDRTIQDDPIVALEIKEHRQGYGGVYDTVGFLIISKWGPEAITVFNPKHN